MILFILFPFVLGMGYVKVFVGPFLDALAKGFQLAIKNRIKDDEC